MNEQFKSESMESAEKSADQIYEELDQIHKEILKLMDQVHKLEMKAGEDGLSKEEFDSIVNERNELAAQFDKKWELEKQLHEKLIIARETEMKKLEKKL